MEPHPFQPHTDQNHYRACQKCGKVADHPVHKIQDEVPEAVRRMKRWVEETRHVHWPS